MTSFQSKTEYTRIPFDAAKAMVPIASRRSPSPGLAISLLTMPVEILAMILDEYHLMDLPLTPLMTVSKYMNEVVKNTPRIWRRILISLDSMPPTLKAGSTMACATEGLLQTCIKRARNSALEATFVVGRIEADSPTPEVRRERFAMLMSRSERISFLCLIINPDTPLQIIKDSFRDLFIGTTVFPALESLMIASAFPVPGLLEVFHPLLDQLERTSVKLRSVYFENVTREFILAAREYKFWRNLRRITIKGEYTPIHVTAFEGCDDLEFLSLSGELLVHPDTALTPPRRGGPLNLPDPNDMDVDPIEGCVTEYLPVHPERKVPLSKVQWLRVGAITMPALQDLNIPNVKFLVIQSALRDMAQTTPLPRHSIHFPSLQVLHVAASHSEIVAISAPSLHTLCLQVSVLKRADADRIVSSLFHGGEGMWAPKTLSINAPIHDKQYEALYKRVPTVETLTVTLGDKPSETFYKPLKKRGILKDLLRFTVDFYALPSPPANNNSNRTTNGNTPSTSTPPQMRTVRYELLTQPEQPPTNAHKLWRGGGQVVSNFIANGTSLLTGGGNSGGKGEGLAGGNAANLVPTTATTLSDAVRPAMREVARVRAAHGLEFALLSCKYGAEHLEEIYAEKNICGVCRRTAYTSGWVDPNGKHHGGNHAGGQTEHNGGVHNTTANRVKTHISKAT